MDLTVSVGVGSFIGWWVPCLSARATSNHHPVDLPGTGPCKALPTDAAHGYVWGRLRTLSWGVAGPCGATRSGRRRRGRPSDTEVGGDRDVVDLIGRHAV